MKHTDIKRHMILVLKPERQRAYGNKSAFVQVSNIRFKRGSKSKVPWIIENVQWQDTEGNIYPESCYRPSDFSRALAEIEAIGS